MMRVKKSTIDSNVRISKLKVAILDLIYESHKDVTQAEWEVVLAALAQDAARYRLLDERGTPLEGED